MNQNANAIRALLSEGTMSTRQLFEKLGISQPTISRSLSGLANEVVRIGQARSIQYALRDNIRGLPEIPVYRVSAEGTIRMLGTLIPVRPDGFVMRQEEGKTYHSDGIPWWLFDMLPQGYLGRAYAVRHGLEIGLSSKLNEWNDTDAMRALLAHGYDVVGNLLLGDTARNHFVNAPEPNLISAQQKAESYARLASEAASGEIPGSSAGGEQPKFTAYVETSNGHTHVIVKFSELEINTISGRWRDLLLAEHFALETLRCAGIPAAKTSVLDFGNQRFLEVERFDRIGKLGRRAVHSLKALDAEFVGKATDNWPIITKELANAGQILPEAFTMASLFWAFGALIGNSDMHNGNLSFIAEHGRPYAIAPAYDMTPMAFAPRSSGNLPDTLTAPTIQASVDNQTWRHALELAQIYSQRMKGSSELFSPRFQPCIAALEHHINDASAKIAKLH